MINYDLTALVFYLNKMCKIYQEFEILKKKQIYLILELVLHQFELVYSSTGPLIWRIYDYDYVK